MGMVPIDNLEVGMVLAADVHDRTGRLLLGTGSALTRKHLMIFRTWGVEEADIEGVEGDELTAQLPADVTREVLDGAIASLEPHFRHAGMGNSAIRELLRLAALKKVLHEVK